MSVVGHRLGVLVFPCLWVSPGFSEQRPHVRLCPPIPAVCVNLRADDHLHHARHADSRYNLDHSIHFDVAIQRRVTVTHCLAGVLDLHVASVSIYIPDRWMGRNRPRKQTGRVRTERIGCLRPAKWTNVRDVSCELP